MVEGFESFKEWFSGFEKQYTIIGGTACDLLMEDYGYDFRATRDIDMVLIIEMFTVEFGKQFWKYIHRGQYKHQQKSTGKMQFYRFSHPEKPGFPAMIELFSRKTEKIILQNDSVLTPFPIDDEVSSLSAILLDEEYYQFLLTGRTIINEVPILNSGYLIPFKAKAWLDLSQRKINGELIDSKNIRKHQNDIFRLSLLLTPETTIDLTYRIKNDMEIFLKAIEQKDINVKQIGIAGRNKEDLIKIIKLAYKLV